MGARSDNGRFLPCTNPLRCPDPGGNQGPTDIGAVPRTRFLDQKIRKKFGPCEFSKRQVQPVSSSRVRPGLRYMGRHQETATVSPSASSSSSGTLSSAFLAAGQIVDGRLPCNSSCQVSRRLGVQVCLGIPTVDASSPQRPGTDSPLRTSPINSRRQFVEL